MAASASASPWAFRRRMTGAASATVPRRVPASAPIPALKRREAPVQQRSRFGGSALCYSVAVRDPAQIHLRRFGTRSVGYPRVADSAAPPQRGALITVGGNDDVSMNQDSPRPVESGTRSPHFCVDAAEALRRSCSCSRASILNTRPWRAVMNSMSCLVRPRLVAALTLVAAVLAPPPSRADFNYFLDVPGFQARRPRRWDQTRSAC